MQSIGFEAAAVKRKAMSAIFDLLCHGLCFMAAFWLIGVTVGNKIASNANDVAIATNKSYNLLYTIEDKNGNVKEKPSYIFSEKELTAISAAHQEYATAKNALPENPSDEELAAVIAKESEAKKYCEVKTLTCDPNVVGSINDYRELVKLAESNLVLLSYSMPLISAAFSAIIFSFIIPLSNSRRQTLGRKIFNLGLVTNKGQTVPWTLLSVRMVCGLIIEFGSILIVWPPYILLISLLMMLMTKQKYTIKDFFSNTVVIDLAKPTEIVARLDVV